VSSSFHQAPARTQTPPAKAGAKAGGAQSADKALLARLDQLQKENAQLKSRSAGAVSTPPLSGEQDELAQAVASLESLRKAQSQGADVSGALQVQTEKVQRLCDARLASKPAHAQLKQLDEQIGKKLKAIERFEATIEECVGKAQSARAQSEEAKGELEKLKSQKQALSAAAPEASQAAADDPLGQMASVTAAVKEQHEGFVSPSSPRVSELQACFLTLEECLSRLRAEVVAGAEPPQPQAPAAATAQVTPSSAPAVAEESAEFVADALEADETDSAWLLGLGLKREHVVDFVQRMRAKRPRRETCG
jgi:DNA repair exonuclease SbcCD ATPase subunit